MTAATIAVGVVGVSFSAPIAAAVAAPALAVAVWRNVVGTAVSAPWALVGHRSEARAVLSDRHRLGLGLVAGAALALHFALWIPSLRLTSVTASTALVTTTPVWVVLLERLRGRRVPVAVVGGVALALAGVLVVTGVDATASPRALLGDLLALLGGMAAAGYVVAGEAVRRHVSTATYTTLAYGSCTVLLVAVCVAFGVPLAGFDARTWLLLLVLAVCAQLLGHTLLNLALPAAGATTITLCLLLEVPGASLVAWVWLGQAPPLAVLPGAVLVLLGLALVVRAQRSASPAAAVTP